MGLADRLRNEALVVGSGNRVYAYAFAGSTLALAEFPGTVRDVAVYQGSVLVAGDFPGIREASQPRKTRFGGEHRWQRIAAVEGGYYAGLHGSLQAVRSEELGIYRLHPSEDLVGDPHYNFARNGLTTVLGGGETLWDAGAYQQEPLPPAGRAPYDGWLRHSISDERVPSLLGTVENPISACINAVHPLVVAGVPEHINGYLAIGFRIFGFTMVGPVYDVFTQHSGQKDLTMRCEQFALGRGNPDVKTLRELGNAVRDVLGCLPEDETPCDPDLCFYDGPLRRVAHRYGVQVQARYRFSALAEAEKKLYAGTVDGRLMLADKDAQDIGAHLLHVFPDGISALATMDEDTFKRSGLRDRMAKAAQLRFLKGSGSLTRVH